MWNLNYGDREWEIEVIKKRNLPIPDWFRNKPTVPLEQRWFWWAYWELDSCRQWTEGMPTPIQWTVIKDFSEYYDIDFEYLRIVVRGMDGAYLDYRAKKRQKDIDEQKRKSKRPRKK